MVQPPDWVNFVPAKIPRIAVYLSEAIKTDLEMLANAERRSVSQMAALLIEESLVRAKQDGRMTDVHGSPSSPTPDHEPDHETDR